MDQAMAAFLGHVMPLSQQTAQVLPQLATNNTPRASCTTFTLGTTSLALLCFTQNLPISMICSHHQLDCARMSPSNTSTPTSRRKTPAIQLDQFLKNQSMSIGALEWYMLSFGKLNPSRPEHQLYKLCILSKLGMNDTANKDIQSLYMHSVRSHSTCLASVNMNNSTPLFTVRGMYHITYCWLILQICDIFLIDVVRGGYSNWELGIIQISILLWEAEPFLYNDEDLTPI